jgi:hypothetical protein
MQRNTKNSLVIGMVLAALLAGLFRPGVASAAQTPGGVTISPATLTLSLDRGSTAKTAEFGVTNTYSVPVVLRFSFDQPVATPNTDSAVKHLSISTTEVTIAPNATVKPVVTLTDSKALAPGSQQAELVVSQVAAIGGNVSIIPSVRLPLAIVKQDGAVTALQVTGVSKPAFAFDIPTTVSYQVANTGNTTTIPRGYVSVQNPLGHEVSKGILNTASAAITPNSRLRMNTAMTRITDAWLPGMYRVQVTYGTGGGAAGKTVAASFFYLPVWQLVLLLLLAAMAYCGRQIWIEWTKLQRLKKFAAATQDPPLSLEEGAI